MLSEKQVKANCKTYFEQAFKILDKKKTEIHFNSKWLKKLGALEIARISNLFGLHEFASRENIAKRMKADKRVSYLELMYPIMQGYDSVAVKADVELGGTDQRFNLLTGRDIQRFYKQEPQDIMTVTLLEGTDGRKMSSSWGNVINVTDSPTDMFGKTMTISDELIKKYFTLATRTPLAEVENILRSHANPRDQKLVLAEHLTALYYGEKKAQEAKAAFIAQFSKGELPSDIPEKTVKPGTYLLSDLLLSTGLVASKSEARRMFDQNGVKVNQKPAQEQTLEIGKQNNLLLSVGKRKFVKIV